MVLEYFAKKVKILTPGGQEKGVGDLIKKSKIALILSFLIIILMLPGAIVKADAIEDLQFGVTASGSITAAADTNTYRIVLSSAGRIDLNIMSEVYDVNVYLEDNQGNIIISKEISYGNEQSPKEWKDSADLEAGTYYIKLVKYGLYLGKYNLLANFTPANTNDLEPNNSTVTARAMGPNSELSGYISWNDDIDVYKVLIAKPSSVSFSIKSYISTVNAKLEDSKGNTIVSKEIYYENDNSSNYWTTGQIGLEAGTYYLKVSKSGSFTGKYDVYTRCFESYNDDNEPNNEKLTAQPLTLKMDPILGFLSWDDNEDIYKVTIPKHDDAYFNINVYSPGVVFELFDSKDNKIIYDTIYGRDGSDPVTYSVNPHLAAGTYYIKLSKVSTGYYYTGEYTLKVDCKSAELTDDKYYENAYNATMNSINLKTQKSINAARKAIEALKGTGAEWAMGEFSKQVDKVQYPILVKIWNAMEVVEANPTQANINAAKASIDMDLTHYIRGYYSHEIDNIQRKLMGKVISAVDKALETKAKEDIDAANLLIEDVKTAADQPIAAWAMEMQKKI